MKISEIKMRIKADHPQFCNSKFEVNNQGWSNLVFEVDNKFIIRIPRNKKSIIDLEFEKEMLPFIREATNVNIPRFTINSSPNSKYLYVGYEKIQGIPLTNEILTSISNKEVEDLAAEIGAFLSDLHSIKQNESSTQTDMYGKWNKLKVTLHNKANGLLSQRQLRQIDLFFSSFEDILDRSKLESKLVHSDFTYNHILFSLENHKIGGIIDFGDLEYNDYAIDFAGIYHSYGKKFMLSVMRHYKSEIDANCITRIETFYLKQIAIHDLLYSIDLKDSEGIQVALKAIDRLNISL